MGDILYYEKVLVEIIDREDKNFRNKEVASVNILWRNNLVERATREAEADMKSLCPYRFPQNYRKC